MECDWVEFDLLGQGDPTMVANLNDTHITLIRKVDQATILKHFGPISLCNVSYKVITKILARRMREVMDIIIGPH